MNPYRHLTILAIIAAATFVFAVEQSRETSFAENYGAVPKLIEGAWTDIVRGQVSLGAIGQLSRLVTSLFVHGDIEHLLWNMVFLWAFGYLTSQILGQWWALAAFFVTGIIGTAFQAWLDAGSEVQIIGASGAVCGFEGIYLGLALRWQLPDADVWPLARPIPPLQLGLFAVVGFLGDMFFLANRGEGIAYGAHAGGFLSGLAIAAVLTTVYPTLGAFERHGQR
ncbi:MAG TPA: rhomboid family intramembrane serine protease [Anaerolineales bacterium]